jgi:protein tyrosine phosphatase
MELDLDEPRDISFEFFVDRSPEIQQIEDDIHLREFPHQAKVRNLELEYKLLKLITETKMHKAEWADGESGN